MKAAPADPSAPRTMILFGHEVELPIKVPYYPPGRLRPTPRRAVPEREDPVL